MDKISIITVSFNSELTIRDTIKSVLDQTYTNIEYIIVDGGSTDATVGIISEYVPKFNGRLKWISERDNGLYDAMNKGIDLATGDIVGTINSDDFYECNDVIEKIVNAFRNSIVDAIYGDVEFVKPNNLKRIVRYYSSKRFTVSKLRFGFMPAHPTFFTYKKYFDEFGYYKTSYKIAADFEMIVRLLYVHKLKTQYIPSCFVKMRLGGISTKNFRSNLILNKEIVKACRENGIITYFPLLFLKYFIKIFELFNNNK